MRNSDWAKDPLFWTETQRGKVLHWRRGSDWFDGDPLGPLPHTHPDASEVYFCTAGSFYVTIGRDEHVMHEGDFCLIPPNTYHHPRLRGDADGTLFVVVSPNHRGRRWKSSGLVDSDYTGRAKRGSIDEGQPLPSDDNLVSEVIEMTEELVLDDASPTERAIYVLNGILGVRYGHLSGQITQDRYLHLPSGYRVTLWPGGAGGASCRVLLISSRSTIGT